MAQMNENGLDIRLDSTTLSLYKLGWISADLSQILDFGQLFESQDYEKADRFFGPGARPFNRFTELSQPQNPPQIASIREGSIVILIAGATLVSSIVMPLVAIAVQNHLDSQAESSTFQISPKDKKLKQILDTYEAGTFGRGKEGLNTLFAILSQRGYDISVNGENIYLIESTIERYTGRIVRTISKNR